MPLKNVVCQFPPERDNIVQELQFSIQDWWGNLLKAGWLPFDNRGGYGNGFSSVFRSGIGCRQPEGLYFACTFEFDRTVDCIDRTESATTQLSTITTSSLGRRPTSAALKVLLPPGISSEPSAISVCEEFHFELCTADPISLAFKSDDLRYPADL